MSTLPDPGFSVEFVAAFILISVESIAIAQFFLSCFINLDPKTQSLAPKVNAKEFLDVDVFIPTYNEPINIIKNTKSGNTITISNIKARRVDTKNTKERQLDPLVLEIK